MIYILIGLQLHPFFSALSGRSLPTLLGEAATVSLAVIVLRIAWVYPAALTRVEERLVGKNGQPMTGAELAVIG